MYYVPWDVTWLSAAKGCIKLTLCLLRISKVRFDQILCILCPWILPFLASWSTVWMILGPGPFPFSPFHTHQSLSIPVREGCFLGIVAWGVEVSPRGQQDRQGGSWGRPRVPIARHIPTDMQGQARSTGSGLGSREMGPWPGAGVAVTQLQHTSGRNHGWEPQLKSSCLGSRTALAEVSSLSLEATSCTISKLALSPGGWTCRSSWVLRRTHFIYLIRDSLLSATDGWS